MLLILEDAMLEESQIALSSEGKVELARKALQEFHAQCFWYLRKDIQVTQADVPEIIRGLRHNGGRRGLRLAAMLCR